MNLQSSYPGCLKFNFPPKRLCLILRDIFRPAGMATSRVSNLFCDLRPCQRLGWKIFRETYIVKGLPFFLALDPFWERNQGPDETQLSQGVEEVRGCAHTSPRPDNLISDAKNYSSEKTRKWNNLDVEHPLFPTKEFPMLRTQKHEFLQQSRDRKQVQMLIWLIIKSHFIERKQEKTQGVCLNSYMPE